MPARYLSTGHSAGEECSSTYEGRHLTLEESYLIHPLHADDLVDHGDPVLFAVGSAWMNGVGVAFNSAAAATDLIAIDTEGIWFLNVLGCISDGTVNGAAKALAAGDPVYICKTAGQANQLSGQDDAHNWIPFGYLLGNVAAHLTVPTLVAVKVHWAPNFLASIVAGVFGDNMEMDMVASKAGGQPELAWMQAFLKTSSILTQGDDLYGIKIRLEDVMASTGGELQGLRLQVHVNNAQNDLERVYGAYVAIANTLSLHLDQSIGLAITMGGDGGVPAMQTVLQMIGDGTLGTLQSWFQTEIGRGAGLKAQVQALGNTSHKIPVNIDGVIYGVPVIAWA